ncbi:DnaJ domain-containing protein, partial [Bartonella sp. AA86SXKL]
MKVDYYEILGVTRECDDKKLKSAFRKLAMQYHPDRNAGDKEAERKFKEIG